MDGGAPGVRRAEPWHRDLCADWYDGPITGVAQAGETGPFYLYELVATEEDTLDIRLYAVARIPEPEFRAIAAMHDAGVAPILATAEAREKYGAAFRRAAHAAGPHEALRLTCFWSDDAGYTVALDDEARARLEGVLHPGATAADRCAELGALMRPRNEVVALVHAFLGHVPLPSEEDRAARRVDAQA